MNVFWLIMHSQFFEIQLCASYCLKRKFVCVVFLLLLYIRTHRNIYIVKKKVACRGSHDRSNSVTCTLCTFLTSKKLAKSSVKPGNVHTILSFRSRITFEAYIGKWAFG